MNTIWIIARGTYEDAIRRKILNVFLFVAIAMLVMAFAFTSFQQGEQMVVIRSLGLETISLAGVFISVILFINLIPIEIERRTIYTILSKPVQRYEFLCGKLLGGLATVLTNIVLMGAAFIALLIFKEHGWDHDITEITKGIVMTFFQISMMGAISMCLSVLISPFVNFFLSFAIYLLGSMSTITESLAADPKHVKSPIQIAFFKILHVIIPNFGNFDIQNPLIHPDVQIHNMSVYIATNIMYALVWIGLTVLIAVIAFDRREV